MSTSTTLFRKRIVLPALFGVLVLGILVGAFLPRSDDFFTIRKSFTIFGALYEEIATGYVDPVDAEKLMRTGIDAMLQTLDPYTVFIDEADNQDIDIMTRGRYGGVGLSIGMRSGRITVTSPMEGYSGFNQGIRTGDVITHIDGQSVEGLSVLDVRNLLRGDPGSAVELVVEREGAPEPINVVLTRAEIHLKNVTYSGFVNDDTASGIGYVRLERFARETGQEIRAALTDLKDTGQLQGLILDLRGNPGGLLDAAVDVVSQFVPRNSVVVSTRGRLPQTEREYRSNGSPMLPDTPLIVLVNGSSASASEIVAGAVQDLDRGLVLGERTFGKGLVQVIRQLPYNTSVKMTTSKYFTPSGRSIQSIDYTHRPEDGYAVVIADSLRRMYRTAGGREVRDGGGIEPDEVISPGTLSDLETALFRRSAFFSFANYFAARNPDVDASFTVSDAVLEEFKQWLEDEEFQYRTDAERSLEELKENLSLAGYSGTLDRLTSISAAIETEKRNDFDRYADRLKEHLHAEILARFLGQTAQIRASLDSDAQVGRAVEYLHDTEHYRAFLNGS